MKLSCLHRRAISHPLYIIANTGCIRRILLLAEMSLPNETGGILVGYRTEVAIEVADALEVPDLDSTPTSYRRDQEVAQRVLNERLRIEPPSSHLGFVGDWHSHTGDAGASRRDLTTLRSNASLDGDCLALLVLALIAPGWRNCGYVTGRPGSGWPFGSSRSPIVFKVPIVEREEAEDSAE